MDWRWANDKPLCEHDKNDKNQGTYVDNLMSLEAYMSLKIRTICPSDICKSWALFQYSIRRLILRSLEASKPQDLYLELSCRFEIWQAPRQHRCRSACQISKWCSILKYQSCGSATTQDLTIRCVIGYWNRAQLAKCYKIYSWSRLRTFVHFWGWCILTCFSSTTYRKDAFWTSSEIHRLQLPR